MSRHRDIRNINIENELDDEAIDDGGEYDMTPEQEAQMNDALEQVRNIVGDEYDCGISDKDLKMALWDRFFDVHQGVNWVFEEKDRRAQARDRKGSASLTARRWDHLANIPACQLPRRRASPNPFDCRDVTTIDPNLIPLSPSDSAVYRLSKYEPPPSMPSSGTRTAEPSPPNPPSVSLPPLENIPDIPDFSSIPSRQPTVSAPPKQSKLAALASSRASKISAAKSDASSSSTTILSGSIRTFPVLRPNSQSIRPPSSTAPSQGAEGAPLSPESSIHSSVINRAIYAAIALETLDKSATQKPSPIANDPPARTPTQSPRMIPPPVENKSSTSRPPSKLALLAQAKAKAGSSMVPSAAESLVKLSTKKALALLPKDHTEILTPTANGPTATTAITTSYQSLFSLTDPSRPHVVPALRVVPFEATRSVDSGDAKQSKLAMKIRKAQEKHTQPSPVEPVAAPPIVSPLFKGKSSQAPAREREKAAKMSSRMPGVGSAQASRAGSPAKGPRKGVGTPRKTSGTSTPLRGAGVDQRQLDLSGLNLGPKDEGPSVAEEPPKMSFAREKLLEEAKKALDAENVKKGSTLMGRLLYELGRLDEKTRTANERGSSKVGKSSFSWAWGLDGTTEERER
ncbi:hypothetical protein PLEOSDRAFT_1075871 [Pleurotus ostreatus PC15]|uniref:HBS1-like protein N-terminal domain-containing protein n=1 Tax=Pleurotus ostreatus (strain PC15) TaxID=1137138 RepID=A0A067NM84_PLEO1|nr:hypothetical protein PLEOSDRAFT_1075871 [Pleurotus ostreatus PC15]